MPWKQNDICVDFVSTNVPGRGCGTYLEDNPNINRKQKTSPSLMSDVLPIESKVNIWKVPLAAMIVWVNSCNQQFPWTVSVQT